MRAIERASNANIAEALTNFRACAERDINLDTENFLASNEDVFSGPEDWPGIPEGCIKSFLERCIACVPIQTDHPFCKDDSPHYNGFMCALKINQCLIESFTGIADDCMRPSQ